MTVLQCKLTFVLESRLFIVNLAIRTKPQPPTRHLTFVDAGAIFRVPCRER